jgi:signal peptide peptidase SppA
MRAAADIFGKPWAILPERLQLVAELTAPRASGSGPSGEDVRARLHAASFSPGSQRKFGVVAVIPVRGIISRRATLMNQIFGGTSIDQLTSQFRAALADSSVKAIVFDVDSPGGTVDGVPELAEEIYKSRSRKKTVAIANPMAASAAYWLASAAGEFVVIPSGQAGSIGVFMAHEDFSKALDQVGVKVTLISAGKYKTDGNDAEPLSITAREDMQSKVDAFYGMFVKAAARGRGVSQNDVRGGFGQGRMVLAADAVKEGMADRTETLDQVLLRLASSGRADGNRSMTAGAPNRFGWKLDLLRRELELL